MSFFPVKKNGKLTYVLALGSTLTHSGESCAWSLIYQSKHIEVYYFVVEINLNVFWIVLLDRKEWRASLFLEGHT